MTFARKGVAIPYIIALVIGLVVLVVVIYWVYKASTSTTLNLQECKSYYKAWCTNCAQMNWPDWHCMPPTVTDCKEILRNSGLRVPEIPCRGNNPDGCNIPDVRKDCAALGVCLNNPEC